MKNKLKKLGLTGAIAVAALYGCKKDHKLEAGKDCTQTKHTTAYIGKINGNAFAPSLEQIQSSVDSCGVTGVNIHINGDTIKNNAQTEAINAAFASGQMSDKVTFSGKVVVREGLSVPPVKGVTVEYYTPANPGDITNPDDNTTTNTPNADSIACGQKYHADSTYSWNQAQQKCVATYNKPAWYNDSLACANVAAPAGYEKAWNNVSHTCVSTLIDKPDTLDLTTVTGVSAASSGFSGQIWVDVRTQIDGLPNRTNKTPNVIFVNQTAGNVTYLITEQGLNRTVWAADQTQSGDIKVINKQDGTPGNMEIGCVTNVSSIDVNVAKKFTASAVKVNKPGQYGVRIVPNGTVSYNVRCPNNSNEVNVPGVGNRYLMKFAAFQSTENGFPIVSKPGLDTPFGLESDGGKVKATLPNDAYVVLDESSTISTNEAMAISLSNHATIPNQSYAEQLGYAPIMWKKYSAVIAQFPGKTILGNE